MWWIGKSRRFNICPQLISSLDHMNSKNSLSIQNFAWIRRLGFPPDMNVVIFAHQSSDVNTLPACIERGKNHYRPKPLTRVIEPIFVDRYVTCDSTVWGSHTALATSTETQENQDMFR
jgi:hypothetical protein|uniref:Uncharacterized protein n=1 Tax=Bionectria ochroleuca TaxID=29856 RepID=A0A8H7N602_BIOOC